jgi:hypothetical protein
MQNNPRLERARRVLGRRMFLRAIAAGASVAMAGRVARLAVAQPSAATKRFFLFFMPHGVAPEHFDPRILGGDPTNFALDQTHESILAPLEPHKSYVNVYQGFQYLGKGDTHTGVVNCLSGVTVADDTSPRTTVERVIARGLGVEPLILGACSHQPYGLDFHAKLFWDGSPVDPEKNPAKAADALFGGATMPDPPQDLDVEFRRELLGLTASELEGLSAELGGLTGEQSKLATHLAAVRELQSGGGGPGQSTCSTRPSLPTVEMVRAASAGQVLDPSGGNDYFYQERNFEILLDAQLDVVAQALICNAAQVIALQPMYSTCDFDFGFMGVPGSHHIKISHTNPVGIGQYNSPLSVDNYDPNTRIDFAKTQRWFVKKLVDRVISLLATADDPSAPGTKVLDNTLVYFMSEIGDGQLHTRVSEIKYPQVPTYLPLVSIGKCAGAIRSGRVVTFPIDKDDTMGTRAARPATDLYLTLARAMGVMNATFPNTTGPVSEVLV